MYIFSIDTLYLINLVNMVAILFVVLIINLMVIVSFVFMFTGAPYVPSKNETVEKMVRLANIKAGQKTLDIGSGDGRVVIAMAKQGAEAHGYDNNPLLVYLARRNVRRAKLTEKAFIHWGNLWKIDYSPYDVVTVYMMPYVMGRLYRKLKKQLKSKAKIISNAFVFPKVEPSKKEKGVYMYEMS